jgi:hypothetical protein
MGAAGRWKDRIFEFWIFPAGRQLRPAGRLPEKKLQLAKLHLAGSKDGGWEYTEQDPGVQK